MFLLSRQTASLSDLFKIPLTSCLSSYENPEVHLVIMGSPSSGSAQQEEPFNQTCPRTASRECTWLSEKRDPHSAASDLVFRSHLTSLHTVSAPD